MGRHMRTYVQSFLMLVLATACVGCAAGADGISDPYVPDGGQDAGQKAQCQSDADCPSGYICSTGTCIAQQTDGGASTDVGLPEDEHFQFQPPVASQNYVFVVNSSLGTVAKIDPGSLAHIHVQSIDVCQEPGELLAIPGTDSAVVLCRNPGGIALIMASEDDDEVIEVPVGQAYTSMAMSPRGRFVILYFKQDQQGVDPSSALNKISVIDLQPAFDKTGEALTYEFAAGYRLTKVLFDYVPGPGGLHSSTALLVSKDEIAEVPLEDLDSTYILRRVWIDNPDAQVVEAREVLASPDANTVIVRSFYSTELTVVDMEQGRSARLPLHSIPTDVDMAGDGKTLLVVERAAGMVAKVDLEQDLSKVVEVDGVEYFDPDGDGVASPDDFAHLSLLDSDGELLVVGQAELFVTNEGTLAALLYTNVERREQLTLLNVDEMRIEDMGRFMNKLVDYVAMSPSGRTALVVHRPDPASPETDPVEREIDALNGYTLLDLPTLASFQQVTSAPIGPLAFSPDGRFAFLTVYDEEKEVDELHVLDLYRLTLRMDVVPLEARAKSVGVLPGGNIAYVFQEHDYGKITFVDMETMAKRAVTGFELNSN